MCSDPYVGSDQLRPRGVIAILFLWRERFWIALKKFHMTHQYRHPRNYIGPEFKIMNV